MPDKTTKKHKHLTYDQREEIQGCLNHGMTFKAIGQRIGKDQTTVSKEVKRHLVSQPLEHRSFDSQGNPLPPEPCPRHLKTPFCCNPCEKKNRLCAYQKRYYHAKPAQKAYESLLVEAREGVPLGRESFYAMDDMDTVTRSPTARRTTPCSVISCPLAHPSTIIHRAPSTSSFPTSTALSARASAANLPLKSSLSCSATTQPPFWASVPFHPPTLSSHQNCSVNSILSF
jgi:hypothetical protein